MSQYSLAYYNYLFRLLSSLATIFQKKIMPDETHYPSICYNYYYIYVIVYNKSKDISICIYYTIKKKTKIFISIVIVNEIILRKIL